MTFTASWFGRGMRGSVGEVFGAFLRLGLTSFGGPIAHLGYFRDELVARRGWLRDDEYADLVALCQVLPGPTSSQVGFALGLRRAGVAGALAAFVAFTLPSAVLMVAVAYGAAMLSGSVGTGLLDGLKIVAVAVVAHAVLGMARTLTPDRRRAGIALAAALIALLVAGSGGQLLALALGVVAGLLLCRDLARNAAATGFSASPTSGVPRAIGLACLVAFALVLAVPPVVVAVTGSPVAQLFEAFSRAGALVFGGGHVVLPLLDSAVVQAGWVGADAFAAGYGAAQAMPGPLFTFAGYLGAIANVGPGGIAGAAIALVAVFLPGFLLLVGALPLWDAFRMLPWAPALLHGANAAVVGILGAALYTPVFTSAVLSPADFGLALACFLLLAVFRLPPWLVVIVGGSGGIVLALLPL